MAYSVLSLLDKIIIHAKVFLLVHTSLYNWSSQCWANIPVYSADKNVANIWHLLV